MLGSGSRLVDLAAGIYISYSLALRGCTYLSASLYYSPVGCPSSGAAAWVGLAAIAKTPFMLVLLICVANTATAFSDVVADSIVVTLARDAPKVLAMHSIHHTTSTTTLKA